MIQKMIDRFIEIKPELLEKFSQNEPTSYDDILTQTLQTMFPDKNYGEPNWENIHTIDDGDYQGTLLFIIPQKGYQPYYYWSVKVDYGSCSVCDTYEAYSTYNDPSASASNMVTLALHMIEEMKEI